MTKVIEGIIENLKQKDLTLSKPFATELWIHLKSDGYELEEANELFHEEHELLYQFTEVGYRIRIACASWGEGVSLPCGEFKTARPTDVRDMTGMIEPVAERFGMAED